MNTKKKMRDLAKKINGRYWINNGRCIVTKSKDGAIYDIVYIISRRCFMLKDIITENKTYIKKRNAVILFMIR